MESMCKTIAVANQKGGTAKSTTAVNLGIGLAKTGKRVLLIDCDSQGSLTASLGFAEPDELDVTLPTIIGKIINDEAFDKHLGVLSHPEGVDLMPCNIELAGIEQSLVNVMRREYILKQYIDMVADDYDYIICDCMPSLGMMTINALTAVESVLIPVTPAYLPTKGLEQLIVTIGKVKKFLNPKIQIEGALSTMVDARTNFSKEIMQMLRVTYGENIRFVTEGIPKSVRAEEASAEGISIYKHDYSGKVAKAYESLVKEVMIDEQCR